MCSTDHDPAEVWEVWSPRARKPHRCDECGGTIEPGESYARVNYLADGSWDTATRCAQCYFLCEAIETLECGDHGSILWGGGGLDEEIGEIGDIGLGEYDEATDNYAPNWAAVFFDAIKASRQPWRAAK